jgi:hypothetical protein
MILIGWRKQPAWRGIVKRYLTIPCLLVLVFGLVLIGCGNSGDEGSSLWEINAANAEEDEGASDEDTVIQDVYSLLCGVYVVPSHSFNLVLLYDDGTYALGNVTEYAYGHYRADGDSMSVDMEWQGTWRIAAACTR